MFCNTPENGPFKFSPLRTTIREVSMWPCQRWCRFSSDGGAGPPRLSYPRMLSGSRCTDPCTSSSRPFLAMQIWKIAVKTYGCVTSNHQLKFHQRRQAFGLICAQIIFENVRQKTHCVIQCCTSILLSNFESAIYKHVYCSTNRCSAKKILVQPKGRYLRMFHGGSSSQIKEQQKNGSEIDKVVL